MNQKRFCKKAIKNIIIIMMIFYIWGFIAVGVTSALIPGGVYWPNFNRGLFVNFLMLSAFLLGHMISIYGFLFIASSIIFLYLTTKKNK